MGVVLFLASAKLFNKTCKTLILDDIVTSFDRNMRLRLLRLLKQEFDDWQILILTHEEFWFELMKKEFPSGNWLFKKVKFDTDNGSTFDESAQSIIDLIAVKRKNYDVTNDLRKLLEQTLKDICIAIEVKVAYRTNDRNELRMADELLSALEGLTDKHKCTEIVTTNLFSSLKTSALITNRGSHASSDQITDGDIDVALSDIHILKSCFHCFDCHRYVQRSHIVPGNQKISCKCGKKQISWKKF